MTGKEPISEPYRIKIPQPTVLMIRKVVIFFIINERSKTAEAKYPMYSLMFSIKCYLKNQNIICTI